MKSRMLKGKGSSARQELLQIQKKIFRQNNEFVRSQALVREKGFESYERSYRRRVRTYKKASSVDELVEKIKNSDIIYVGDYHTNKQSQRTLLRLMRILKEEGILFSVGLELVQARHQSLLDAHQAGTLSETTFLKKINFKKYWYFDLWENFKPIFDYAREEDVPLFAIEWSLAGDSTLEKRDQKDAEVIASIMSRFSKTTPQKMIIFVGDLHIAPSHLPRQVDRALKAKGLKQKSLIIYQNSESIYWNLAEDGVEDHVEIVSITENEFCIINTPPIIWQQSYLNWLEHEEGEIDYVDAKHSFMEFLKRVADFLEVSLETQSIEEPEVFTCGDLSFLKRLSEDDSFSKTEIKRIKKQILASESYCLPVKHIIYLANLSVNHASEEAAHYLKYLVSGAEKPRSPVDAFYANVLHEAIGFFGSKIVNHKRKCLHEKQYQDLVEYLKVTPVRGRDLELQIALLVLKHVELEKRGLPIRSERYFKGRHDLFFGVTHGLGYRLGDRLYYALVSGKIDKAVLREVLQSPFAEPGEPFEIYRKLLRKVRGVKIPKRV